MVLELVGLQICVPEFIWTVINFFLLMFLLKKFLYTPILSFMDERQARIDAGLEEGKKAEQALEENSRQLSAELTEKGQEARAVISEARSEAEKVRSEKLEKAHAEAEAIFRQARETVKKNETKAQSEIDGSMTELVGILSKKLLGSDEASRDEELIKSCMNKSEG